RKRFYDGVEEPKEIPKFLIELYGFQKEGVIDRRKWLEKSLDLNIMKFWFSVMGMIDFKYLKSIKLKFLDGIIYEDQSFGVLLFLQLKNIFIFPVKMYNYRIRVNSIMNHDKKIKKENFHSYMMDIYKKFSNDNIKAKKYIISYSWCTMALQLLKFMYEEETHKIEKKFLKRMISNYFLFSIMFKKNIHEDPCNIDLLIHSKINDLIIFMNSDHKGFFMKKVEEKKRCFAYQLGNKILTSRSLINIVLLPYGVFNIIVNYKIKKHMKILSKEEKEFLSKNSDIYLYLEYLAELKVKNYFSYKLGHALIKNFKIWYKGGIFKLPFDIYKIYKTHEG
ncbi:hypothetical protein HDK09_000711, partial [Campylobacter lari]|nr:hypothetical protein [Campylobacter lari]